jgi:xanthine dehydrogenase accessory factor
LKRSTLERLLSLAHQGMPAGLVTQLSTGLQALVTRQGVEGDLSIGPEDLAQVLRAIDEDRAGTMDAGGSTIFVDVWNPRPRLLIIGAVHTAQALVPLARLAEYDVTIIDPRGAFASAERFPNITLRNDWPDEALTELAPNRRTAVLTLTHDPKIDDPALHVALRSEAFYVGALGSRRTHEKRIERLRSAGFDDNAIRRIRGPVGLAIGARTPAEIAISIMAEITAVLRGAPLGSRS